MSLVVIGTTEFLPGFALAGVRETVLASRDTVLSEIAKHQDAQVIILDESLAETLGEQQRELLETSIRPVIIFLGSQDAQTLRLRQGIRTTVGVDLL